MTVNPVASSTSAAPSQTTSSASASNPLQSLTDPNTFLNLLVAQLKYQDPLNPTSGTQFLSQTAQLTEVETMNQLSTEVSQEAATQQQQASTSMIGQTVSATLSDGSTVSGVVQGVSLTTSGGPTLNVNGTSVPLSAVQSVGTPPAA
jgi:flagellar basal-body rod modification protein FlgD